MKRFQDDKLFSIFLIIAAVFIFWNYWFPAVKHFFYWKEWLVDFKTYYYAGVALREGHTPYLNVADVPNLYVYPPALLPFYSLFTFLSLGKAGVAWLIFDIFLFTSVYGVFLYFYRKYNLLDILSVSFFLMAMCCPMMSDIVKGQINIIVSSLAFLGFIAYRSKHKILSAFFIAVCTLIKVHPVELLIFFVFYNKDFEYLVYYCLSFILLFCISLLWVPLSLYTYYISNVLPGLPAVGNAIWDQSLTRFFYWAGSTGQEMISFLGLTGFLYFIVKYANKRKYEFSDEVYYLMNILIMLLFTGRSWHQNYVWVFFPAAILFAIVTKRADRNYVILFTLSVLFAVTKLFYLPILDSFNIIGAVLLLYCLLQFEKRVILLPACPEG